MTEINREDERLEEQETAVEETADLDESNPMAAQMGLVKKEPPKQAVAVKGKAVSKIAGKAAAKAGTKQAPEPPPAVTGPLLTVVTRNEFYRDGFHNMVRIAILEAVIIVGLIVAIVAYMSTAKPHDRYFATTADGRIMQLVPLDQPNMSQSALMSWVAQSVTDTFTFSYNDYQKRLQDSSAHFTRHGWDTFTTALQKSKIIDSVVAGKQVVSATPRSAPILQDSGVYGGKYRWKINIPINVTYKAGDSTRIDNMDVNLVIERVPSLENPTGVGIEQWIATTSTQ